MPAKKRTPKAPPALRNRIVGHDNVAPDQLLANPGNFRRHPGEQLDALRGSLDELGWIKQVIVNTTTGHVIDGHARIEEALARNEKTIPVTYVELSPDEERLALAVLDPISEMARQDDDALRDLLKGIEASDARLSHFLEELRGSAGEPFAEDLSKLQPPPAPVTKPGDLLILGDHVVLCGDSTDPAAWERLMAAAPVRKAHAMWTDPPYNVGYKGGPDAPRKRLANDNMSPEDFRTFLSAVFDLALARLEPGGACYVAAPSGPPFLDFGTVLRARGIWRQTLTWVKHSLVLGRADYHYRHEVIFEGNAPLAAFEPEDVDLISYGWKPGDSHRWVGGRSLDTVFEVPKPSSSEAHPTMKPVALIRPMVEASTLPGHLILDPFAGSGSTVIACEESGRLCAGIELEPEYCDVIAMRWELATGEAARRESLSGSLPETPKA